MMSEKICEGIDWICDLFAKAGHGFVRWIDNRTDFECGFICGIGLCFLLWLGE